MHMCLVMDSGTIILCASHWTVRNEHPCSCFWIHLCACSVWQLCNFNIMNLTGRAHVQYFITAFSMLHVLMSLRVFKLISLSQICCKSVVIYIILDFTVLVIYLWCFELRLQFRLQLPFLILLRQLCYGKHAWKPLVRPSHQTESNKTKIICKKNILFSSNLATV